MKHKAVIAGLFAAFAAAPSIGAAQSIGLHGFADVSVKNDYVTPRGLVVTTAGTTVQALDGLVLDIPLDPKGVVTDVSFVAGTWQDWNPGYDPARNAESFNEFDWFLGANAKIGKDWKVGAQYVEFDSPQHANPNFGFVHEQNVEFSLAFDDSSYIKGFSFQPYAKLFYASKGGSTVVLGKQGDTFDVEIGAVPNIDLHPYNIPITLSAPTWLTVGPSTYWNAAGGGGNLGVFSTGVKASYPLPLPPTAGHWSLYANYQYYHLINDALVTSEFILTGHADRDVSLYMMGVSLGF